MSLVQSAILLIARRAGSLCGLLTGVGVSTVVVSASVGDTVLPWLERLEGAILLWDGLLFH